MKNNAFGDESVNVSTTLGGLAQKVGVIPEDGFGVPKRLF